MTQRGGGLVRPRAPAPPASANMQGDERAWINDPHIHALYQLAVAAFAKGPGHVDKAGSSGTRS